MNLVLVDDHFALVPADPDDPEAGAVLVRGAALVRSFRTLFEYCWYTAAPCPDGDTAVPAEDALSEQQRAVLRMLASGMKDEKIARALGVSLRTVSRLVSELMQELNTGSRFEAGVRAARRGWLD
ncbi:helix-turn-helix domain-containing protein [Streptomyces litchfieldiae]|uniref:Helix-turn-helix domain-containing protein n=1 Tax=Streptomyces litchfieldiae TaxID=3075543 RepID=A0ABU2MRW7_9ACTN|nr:helix-turn-helix domain-containing protein [Streptomyces sp. DSM 44938]MDT0344374.1 helix-turn-helix domain-containing protein [Streptomyces sp. DSM 44938]